MPRIVIERESLYREVWTRPLSKVAVDYGLSDRGLAKICARLDVPTPPRGYWANLESGQKPRIPALPEAKDGFEESVQIRQVAPRPDFERIPEPEVVVSGTLRAMHPLVKATQLDLSDAYLDTQGRLHRRQGQGLDIRVSKTQVHRALRIANALVRKLEEMGFTLGVGPSPSREHESWVVIGGERVQIKLRELSRMNRDPQPDRYGYRRCTFKPTARLELSMDEYVDTGSVKRVRDRLPDKPIESQLGRFIVGLHACAEALRRQRLDREEKERRWETARREAEHRARLASYRAWLRKDLLRQATAHQEARLIRDFLAALRSEDGRLASEPENLAWLAWAREESERIDPVSNGERIIRPLVPPEDWTPSDPERPCTGRW